MTSANERRAAWRQYACAAMTASAGQPKTFEILAAEAEGMLALEDDRFRADTSDLHAALATARAHALEQQTRAENAGLALKMVRANVSVSELRKLLDRYDREGGFSGGALATCVGGLCAAAEQRAAAKPAEGGEP